MQLTSPTKHLADVIQTENGNQIGILMKKLIAFIIAFAATASIVTAGPLQRKGRDLQKQIDRINNFIEERGDDLAEGKAAALEHRLAVLELQQTVRAEVKEAVDALKEEYGEDLTREQVKEAVMDIRVSYKDQFMALKEERRALRQARRDARDAAEEETEESTPEG